MKGMGASQEGRRIIGGLQTAAQGPLGTIPRLPVPRSFRCCRAIKRYSVMRCNLAVIRSVRAVVDVAATIVDDDAESEKDSD